MSLLQSALEFFRREAYLKNLERRLRETERKLETARARAERAETFWSERQTDVMEYSLKLQMEKEKSSKEQAENFMQFARLLELIGKRLEAFDIAFAAALDKDDRGYFLKDGINLVFSPKAVISLFCELLSLPEERFWENINDGWKMVLQGRIRDKHGVPRKDKFSDLNGRLYAAGHCGKCSHKEEAR